MVSKKGMFVYVLNAFTYELSALFAQKSTC
jgi:hypothetical protein